MTLVGGVVSLIGALVSLWCVEFLGVISLYVNNHFVTIY